MKIATHLKIVAETPETQPEIPPSKSPHIDIPMPDAPHGPLTTPEKPVPVKAAAQN